MVHKIALFCLLAALWLLLSGHYTGLLLSFGVLSCALVMWLSVRMSVVDREGYPVHLVLVAPRYWGWLTVEIIKASWQVARCVVHPRLPISPAMAWIDTRQSSELGQAIYANSITLTPGTMSVGADANRIQVHALTGEGLDDLREGEMDRQVARLERPR